MYTEYENKLNILSNKIRTTFPISFKIICFFSFRICCIPKNATQILGFCYITCTFLLNFLRYLSFCGFTIQVFCILNLTCTIKPLWRGKLVVLTDLIQNQLLSSSGQTYFISLYTQDVFVENALFSHILLNFCCV